MCVRRSDARPPRGLGTRREVSTEGAMNNGSIGTNSSVEVRHQASIPTCNKVAANLKLAAKASRRARHAPATLRVVADALGDARGTAVTLAGQSRRSARRRPSFGRTPDDRVSDALRERVLRLRLAHGSGEKRLCESARSVAPKERSGDVALGDGARERPR